MFCLSIKHSLKNNNKNINTTFSGFLAWFRREFIAIIIYHTYYSCPCSCFIIHILYHILQIYSRTAVKKVQQQNGVGGNALRDTERKEQQKTDSVPHLFKQSFRNNLNRVVDGKLVDYIVIVREHLYCRDLFPQLLPHILAYFFHLSHFSMHQHLHEVILDLVGLYKFAATCLLERDCRDYRPFRRKLNYASQVNEDGVTELKTFRWILSKVKMDGKILWKSFWPKKAHLKAIVTVITKFIS